MKEPQLTEIRNYLLSKKLPIDILIEVNDHFVSQISDVQKEENLSFDEAFEKTKEYWKEEFRPTNSYLLSFKKIPKIAKKILYKNYLKYFINSFYITIPILIFWIFSAHQFTFLEFRMIYKSTNMVFLLLFVIFVVMNVKSIIKLKKYKDKVSFLDYQNINNIMLSAIYTIQIFVGSDENAKHIHDFFSNNSVNIIAVIISMSFPIIMFSFVLINIQVFLNFNKVFKKITT